MNRIKLFVIIFMFLNMAASSQPYTTGAGLRLGFPYGFSVKHFFDHSDAFELIAAANLRGFIVAGFFQNEHEIGIEPRFYWYWGLGVHGGVVDAERTPYLYTKEIYTGPVLGVDALVGLDYVFRRIPLNLSFDIVPSINLAGYTGWNGLNTAISVRYLF